jgi:hypothetical protein
VLTVHKKTFAAVASLLLISAGWVPAAHLAQDPPTQEIIFGTPKIYNHKSGWFTLSVPGNWNIEDKSAEGEVVVSIGDPSENAIVVVRVYPPPQPRTQEQLGEVLKSFLSSRMGSFDGFVMGELKSQRDGSLGLYFKYNSVVDKVSYKMYGDAFIEQHNGLVGFIALIMPQNQYDTKKNSAYEMVNSFRVTGSAP